MEENEDQDPRRGMHQSQQPNQERPDDELEQQRSLKPGHGAGGETKKGEPKKEDKEEEPERVTRVRYEKDDEPPLSGGTSQILTR